MTRLINADKYKNHLVFYQWTLEKFYPNCNGLIARVIALVDDMETVDAVPVIRCKDCKHFMNDNEICMDDDGLYNDTCPYMGEATVEDFCSRAERKEE